MKISAVILAAGASTRLGRPKQLIETNGRTLLRRAVETAFKAGIDDVVVVLGSGAAIMEPHLEGLPVRILLNDKWSEGLSESLKLGIRNVASENAALVMLVDLPNIDADALKRLTDAFFGSPNPIAASSYGDTNGVPAVFSRETFGEFESLTGDKGAKALFGRFETLLVDMPEAGLDLDTVEDLERWLDA